MTFSSLKMSDSIFLKIKEASDEIAKLQLTRELSVVLTKLEEAYLWYCAYQTKLKNKEQDAS